MPAIASLTRWLALAAAAVFAFFVAAKGIPTLRHDWTWPIDRTAVGSFMSDSINGWISNSFGMANPNPTTYLIALPVGAAMGLFGPLVALILFALIIGYVCMRAAADAASRWGRHPAAALGFGLFALFNPWVYNQVVAGHLVMVLAYGALIGMLAEMLRGRESCAVRLALWIALVQAQLQFYIPAMIALAAFAVATRKWLPLVAGVVVASPSIVGLIAERAALLRIPYGLEWQTNQSVAPLPLLALGGYFPGYADRLGVAAAVAVWVVLVLAVAAAVAERRSRKVLIATAAAVTVYVIVLGVHGPLAVPYSWVVRKLPESGVFRELYDLAGIFAALVVVVACAAGRFRALSYLALAAGIALPVSWAFHPPSDLWVGARGYPHPAIEAPPFGRVALLPAFQPLSLATGGGDGADPDAFVYPHHVAALNAYFPTYPVDAALAQYEQNGDAGALRALGVTLVVGRPWLVSRTNGAIGLAATSLAPENSPAARNFMQPQTKVVNDATPLVSECGPPRIAGPIESLDACELFFGDRDRAFRDMPSYAPVQAVIASSDSIDPRTSWIDARLAFAQAPSLAQALGGALTQSALPFAVEQSSWLFAYVRGTLRASDGRELAKESGTFAWIRIPPDTTSVRCEGTCELVAQTPSLPIFPARAPFVLTRAVPFRAFAPWFYVVDVPYDPTARLAPTLLRFNERYDPAWTAWSAQGILPHVRIDMTVNGWPLPRGRVVLVESVAFCQFIAEIIGFLFVISLLKALRNVPTKRVRPQ